MGCPSCGRESPTHARFCMHCGSGLAQACAGCGAELPGEARFCPRCGGAIEEVATSVPAAPLRTPHDYTPRHLAERILASKTALEGERKQVTTSPGATPAPVGDSSSPMSDLS